MASNNKASGTSGSMQSAPVGNSAPLVPAHAVGNPAPTRATKGLRSGSGFVRKPGTRIMKEYPLSKGELYGLASLGGMVTLCFSLGAALFGSSFTLNKDIAFSSSVPEKVLVYYSTVSNFAFWGSIGLFALGVSLVLAGGIRVSQIISETDHD